MDINLLVQRLQHGESYTVHNALGDPYQENRPPTQLHLKAAEAVIALSNQVQQSQGVIHNLQRQLQELAEQYELLQRSKSASETNNSN
jgi:uncharacterized coiled-coil protein SlyX